MNQTEVLTQILTRCKLYNPIPPDVRKRMFRAKRRTLIKILKAHQESGFLRSPALSFFSMIRQFGSSIPAPGIPFAIRAASFAAACIIIAAGAFTVHRFLFERPAIVIPINYGTVIFAIGDVEIRNPGEKARKAEIKDIVYKNAVIKTGKRSGVSIQIDQVGVMRVLDSSQIALSAILENGNRTDITLSAGRLFSKILKHKTGGYRVKTNTCVIAVRGTEFLTSYSRGRASVKLLRGSVSINTIKNPEKDIPLKEKHIAYINKRQGVRISSMSRLQELRLKKISLHPYIENIKEKTSVEILEIFRKIQSGEKKVDAKIRKVLKEWADLPALSRLRKLGKRTFMLHLRDGTKIAGSISSRDAKTIRVDTGDGVITIPKKDIVRRMPLK